jgi:hypothetical protein
LTFGKNEKKLQKKILTSGDVFHVPPKFIHRLEGLAKLSKIFEVSTPELTDVVKLADDYGRRGKGNDEKLDEKLATN